MKTRVSLKYLVSYCRCEASDDIYDKISTIMKSLDALCKLIFYGDVIYDPLSNTTFVSKILN